MAKVLSADHESVRYGNVKEFWMCTVDHVYYHNCEVCIFVAQVYVILVPTGSPSCGGDVAVYVLDIKQPSLPTPFHSVLVSIYVFMALSAIFYSINSPDNSPLSQSVLPILFLPYWSFQLCISL